MSTDPSKLKAERTGVIFPSLTVHDAKAAISTYREALGAEVVDGPAEFKDGRVMHCELRVFNARVFVQDDFPEWRGGKKQTPVALGATPVGLHVAVPDVDAVHARAVKGGFKSEMPPQDQFWGDRYCKLTDPFGHEWAFSTPLKGGPETWPKMTVSESGDWESEKKKAKEDQ